MFIYPVHLNLQGKSVLVIGGGNVATRKVLGLLEAGARITLVSPEITPEIKKAVTKQAVVWVNRKYSDIDLGGAMLVFAATDNAELNEEIARQCHLRRIFCNVVNNPHCCDFVTPSRIRRGSLTITISTDGKAPLLTKKIRQELEEHFGPEMEKLVDVIGKVRRKLIFQGKSLAVEKMSRLDLDPLKEILKLGNEEDGEKWLNKQLGIKTDNQPMIDVAVSNSKHHKGAAPAGRPLETPKGTAPLRSTVPNSK